MEYILKRLLLEDLWHLHHLNIYRWDFSIKKSINFHITCLEEDKLHFSYHNGSRDNRVDAYITKREEEGVTIYTSVGELYLKGKREKGVLIKEEIIKNTNDPDTYFEMFFNKSILKL